jgi:hypothetical protein
MAPGPLPMHTALLPMPLTRPNGDASIRTARRFGLLLIIRLEVQAGPAQG